MRKWTRKAVAWTAGGMIVLAVGLWRQDFQVVALGIVMALFILVAYVRRFPRVEVQRRPSKLRVLEGDIFDMRLRVGAHGAWADSVEVYDQLPGYTRLSEGCNHIVMPLYKGEAREAVYRLDCPLRGAFRIGPLHVRTSDAVGFYDEERTLEDLHELDVYPLYVELRSLDLTSRALKYNMGPVTVNELGRSTDFYSIREYIKGDPYKKINWKASARLKKLMINEDEKETLSDCAIFIDSRGLAAVGTAMDNFHETSVRAALGLSRTLVASKNRVMVVTYNDSVNIVPPGLGHGHNGIVQAMLVETISRGALTFDWAVGYSGPFIKPRSDVVVFSPLVSDLTFYPAVLSLMRAGHRVVVVTAPLERYEERATGKAPERQDLTMLQRATTVEELTMAGVQVIEVDPDEPQLSIMVRVGAALGGELLDVEALEEGKETRPQAPVEAGGREDLLRRIWTEAMGFRIDLPYVLVLQFLAMLCLFMASFLNYHVNIDVWRNLSEMLGSENVIDSQAFLLLTVEGILLAWAINMGLGVLKVLRENERTNTLAQVGYLAIALLVIWHIVSLLWNILEPEGTFRVIRDLILFTPLIGALSIFRRMTIGAAFAMGFLVIFGLVYANPMTEARNAIIMALASVAFLELAWAVHRFNDLSERVATRANARGLWLLHDTMVRYATVLSITLLAATVLAWLITYLPSWYVEGMGPGSPRPWEVETPYGPVYLLAWLVLLTVVGRWMVLAAGRTPWGQRLGERLRTRLVLPSRTKGSNEGGEGDEGGPAPAPTPVFGTEG